MLFPIGDDNRKVTRTPVLVISLLVVNVVLHLWQWLDPSLIGYACTPYEIIHFKDLVGVAEVRTHQGLMEIGHPPGPTPILLTMVTCMFLHADPLHLAGNMLFLWIFGDQIEDRLGRARFIFFYLGCGLLATIGHILTNWGSPVPMLGASGAISGVMGAYMIRFPTNRIRLLFLFLIVIEVPAVIAIGLWFVMQILEYLGGSGGNVAYMAHIAGFVGGILLMRKLDRGPRKAGRVAKWRPV